MPGYVETFNKILSLGTILLEIASILILVSLVFFRSTKNPILVFFKRYGILFAFIVAFGSVALSLFYSDVIGFTACELCIVQRFFIYPQVLFLGIALGKPKKFLVNISALLAFLGMLVSIYHVYGENGGASSLGCLSAGVGQVSCAARYVYEFGYITIPVMALSAQIFMLLIALNIGYFSKREMVVYTS
jgi:disulfide bond formation protein DsbB